MSQPPSTTRFSTRVADYVRARPTYPAGVVEVLQRIAGRDAVVADVGSGTGISTRLLLDAGHIVFAVEPNNAMRMAAEEAFASREHFHSVNGTAEATTIAAKSVDLVLAAQAFHWFDRDAFRRECVRILKPGGHVALLWNGRLASGSPFLERYERLLERFGTDYVSVNHRNISDDGIAAFFAPGRVAKHVLPNAQTFDFDGLKARLLSSSYAPPIDDPRAGPMVDELRRVFDDTQEDDRVEMRYETELFIGKLDA